MSDLLTKQLNGFHLIDASAGTGKTYTITALVVRLLLERQLSLAEILIVTYTEAAAQDLRKRVRETLVKMRQGYVDGKVDDVFIRAMLERDNLDHKVCEKRIQLALNEFDEAAIFTIHGFCQRSLKENGLESGMSFDMELEKDMSSCHHQVACDYWRQVADESTVNFLSFCGEKLQPESLVSCINQLRPELDIIPNVETSLDLSRQEERYQQSFKRVGQVWQKQGDEVRQVLAEQTSLSGVKYKKASLPKWADLLDAYFQQQGSFPPSPPDQLEKFTTSLLGAGLKKGKPAVEHPFFDLAEALWQDWQGLSQGYAQHLLFLQRRFYGWAAEELDRLKEAERILSFDDLLNRLYLGLSGGAGGKLAALLRQQYPAILIDEFQDTDPIQFKIFQAIHGLLPDHLLYLIGDPKQAIYNFRGADIFAYLQARETVNNRESLSYNYRSEQGLVDGVNHLFACENPFLIDDIGFEPAQFPEREKDRLVVAGDDLANIHILFAEREPLPIVEGKKPPKIKSMSSPDSRQVVALGCCAEVSRLLRLAGEGQATLGDRPVQPQDIAILVRENKEARRLQRLLLAHGVASVVKDNENLFTSPEATELYLILRGVASKGDQQALACALATSCLGKSAMDLHLLRDRDEGWDDILTRFYHYLELWQERGLMVMIRALLATEEVRERLLSMSGGERRLTNILHLAELLHKQSLKNPPIGSLLEFFKTHLAGESQDDEYEQRLESDGQRVQILTIHKAKGLEFPIVFCPFLWKGLRRGSNTPLFHAEADKKLTLDLGSDDVASHKKLAQFENMAESLRLAYVALTRATNRCYISWGGYYSFESSPLAYLLHGKGGDFELLAKALKACADEELRGVVNDLASGSSGTIVVRENPNEIIALSSQSQLGHDLLPLPLFQAELDRDWHVTSFSRLTSGHHHESLITDRDQVDDGDHYGFPQALNLFDFPRGANPGTFLHYLFEHQDFNDLDSEDCQQFITEALGQFGYEEKWLPVMQTMLVDVCRRVLPGQNFCLADVKVHERLNELEFHFPLSKVSSGDCADLMRRHGGAGGEAWYAQLEGYGFQIIKGFMKGFIDLVFCREDRFFVVDWKSNYLGNIPEAYGVSEMTESMTNSGYILQYHLYCLALHRYLATRIEGYRYERHFGGVFYVYLRGVSLRNAETGVFWDRPSFALIDELDTLFTPREDGI